MRGKREFRPEVLKRIEMKKDKTEGFSLNLKNAVSIDTDQMEIPDKMLEEWQSVVDLIARITRVRAALIMRVRTETIEVFVASRTKNSPYHPGNRELFKNSGLYCESVINSGKMLSVPDASKSDRWRNNPDMKYQMKCYLGFPIRLPNGHFFGTICMLDDKANDFSQDIRDFMEKMRDLIESYLDLLLLSITDPLTGVYNRTHLEIRSAQEMERADRDKSPISALLIDVDHFKKVNDTFGHLAGDRVLKHLAGIIASTLKNTDLVFRFGGDEFIVLMPAVAIDGALAEAEQLRARVENSQACPGWNTTVSVGAAERAFGESLDRWFMRADQALYRAKSGGRNRAAEECEPVGSAFVR